ncbi:uncharacterized protein HKW66_Vig0079310 [Vigna angularis]|uniref:Uncharacterized protein n=1 Tax=Phaseolus angularis TaxID=3914 RepID=A0A8T0K4V6_PHAAN|nr:uncharacterized protein HKW66_Vig0079310 [Vigna angularis]
MAEPTHVFLKLSNQGIMIVKSSINESTKILDLMHNIYPTRSPTITPVIHLHRRKTLPEARVRHKLKDLFVSSPPPPLNEDKTIFYQQQQQRKEEEEEENKDQPVELIPNSALSLRLRTGSSFRGAPPQLSARYPPSSATGC